MKRALVAILGLLLLACATGSRLRGPQRCTTTPCGDVCCDSDGKVCPPCWLGISPRR